MESDENKNTMVKLGEGYEIPKKKFLKKISNERQEILSLFEQELNNEERAKMGFPPISPIRIVVMVKRRFGRADTNILRWLYADCKDAKNFSKCFWWKVKQRDLTLF